MFIHYYTTGISLRLKSDAYASETSLIFVNPMYIHSYGEFDV